MTPARAKASASHSTPSSLLQSSIEASASELAVHVVLLSTMFGLPQSKMTEIEMAFAVHSASSSQPSIEASASDVAVHSVPLLQETGLPSPKESLIHESAN